MKLLIWKLILPLTIISFVFFTKWWYVDIIDGTEEILIGFPFPYMTKCWHTSLCLQIFIRDLLIDFLVYFFFWLFIISLINNHIYRIKINKIISIVLLSFSGILLIGIILIGVNSDNIYTWNRNFEVIELESGYKFIWDENYKPNYQKYH